MLPNCLTTHRGLRGSAARRGGERKGGGGAGRQLHRNIVCRGRSAKRRAWHICHNECHGNRAA